MYIQLIKLETLFRNGEDKMMKKLLSMICAICTIFMLFPTVIFAEGDKYDLWQVGKTIYYAESGEHTDFNQPGGAPLKKEEMDAEAFLPHSGTYILQTNIDLTWTGYYILISGNINLDLNGKTVNRWENNISFEINGAFTIQDSSNGGGFISGDAKIISGSLTLLSGKIANINNRGTFYADGGTITEALDNVKGTIDKHSNTAGTRIEGNTYNGVNCTINNGLFYGDVYNFGTINKGVFWADIIPNGGSVSPFYDVSFYDGSNEIYSQRLVNINQALEPEKPTKDGYEFEGWYKEDGTKYDFNLTVTDDITLEAKWTLSKYDVYLNTNSGTINSGNITEYTYGQGATLPTDVTRPGHTFAGWYDDESFSGSPVTEISKTDTGIKKYWAKWDANTYTVKFDTDGGSSINNKTGVTWTDTVLDGVTAPTKDGWEFTGWKCGNTIVEASTKYSDLVEDDTITNVTLVAQWKDITAPTGEISIGTNKWNGFLNTITFGLFFKDTQTVTITASDNSGEDVTIEYLLSNKALNETELASATFTSYTEAFNINPDNKYVVYAKLIDTSDNVTYLSSDGIVLDATVPVISGIENGKTYCKAQIVTITEENIESVKVNGTAVTLDENNQFTLNPAEGTQTIVVIDRAGNGSAEMTVTVNDGHTGGEATCTKKAECVICGEKYGELDLDNHNLKHTVAKEATATETGNIEYWQCIDCEKYFLDEEGTKEIQFEDTIISKKAPEIIKGKGQSVNQREKKELSFTSNASYDDFKYVKLDGNELDPKNYTVKEGSTIVTLNKDFVSTLKSGKHTIGIVSETGEASTEFTVNKKTSVIKPSSDKNTTNTGLISNIGLWISLMFTSLDAMIIGFVLNKKRRS